MKWTDDPGLSEWTLKEPEELVRDGFGHRKCRKNEA